MTAETYESRMGRINEAIALGKPDRVPIFPSFHLFRPDTRA